MSSGDRVMAENYLQHAEHYNRIIAAAQAQMPIQQVREQSRRVRRRHATTIATRWTIGNVERQRQRQRRDSRRPMANGSGPQPVIEGTPAEVALNPEAAPATATRRATSASTAFTATASTATTANSAATGARAAAAAAVRTRAAPTAMASRSSRRSRDRGAGDGRKPRRRRWRAAQAPGSRATRPSRSSGRHRRLIVPPTADARRTMVGTDRTAGMKFPPFLFLTSGQCALSRNMPIPISWRNWTCLAEGVRHPRLIRRRKAGR